MVYIRKANVFKCRLILRHKVYIILREWVVALNMTAIESSLADVSHIKYGLSGVRSSYFMKANNLKSHYNELFIINVLHKYSMLKMSDGCLANYLGAFFASDYFIRFNF